MICAVLFTQRKYVLNFCNIFLLKDLGFIIAIGQRPWGGFIASGNLCCFPGFGLINLTILTGCYG